MDSVMDAEEVRAFRVHSPRNQGPVAALTGAGPFLFLGGNMDYVKFYKESYGIKFSSKYYDIHHIDKDRTNNTLSNLILLPKEIHQAYHQKVPPEPLTFDLWPVAVHKSGQAWNKYAADALDAFLPIFWEVQEWVCYKAFLDGEIPNIFKKELKI